MKKCLLYAIALLLGAPLFFSCEDNRMNDMVADKVYLRQHGTQEVFAFPLGGGEIRFDLWAFKGGTLGTSGNVRFTLDPGLIDEYNAAAGDDGQLQTLPAECYRIPYLEFNVSGESPAAKFYFYYNPDVIADNYGTGRRFALPLRIEADGLEVNEAQSSALIVFDIDYMLVGFNEYLPVMREIAKGDAQFNESLTLTIPSEFTSDIRISLSTDNESYVDAYNADYGTDYSLLPSEYYSLENTEPVIAAGSTTLAVPIKVSVEDLPSGRFILPVAIETVQGASINPQRRICYFIYLNSSEWLTAAMDKELWSILNASSNGSDGNSGPHRLIDGSYSADAGGYWGVNYSTASGLWDSNKNLVEGKDQWVIVDLGSEVKVSAVRVTARSSGFANYKMQIYLATEAPAASAGTPSWTDGNGAAKLGFLYNGLYSISTVDGATTISDSGNTAEGSKWIAVTDIFSGGSLTVEKTLSGFVNGRYLLLRMPECKDSTAIAEIDIQRQK